MKQYIVLLGVFISLLFGGIQLQAKPSDLIPPPDVTGWQENQTSVSTAISGAKFHTFLSIIIKPTAIPSDLDVQNRQSVTDFYNIEYRSTIPAINWNGDHEQCDPGTVDPRYQQAIAKRINYYRAMAGLPAEIVMDAQYNEKAQAAALMMSINEDLDHTPSIDWKCYSTAGFEGAGSSNLYLGRYGLSAIDGYIQDPGSGNYAVGHRRWILYPWTRTMGTGDIPPVNGYRGSNALWVFGDTYHERLETRDVFVAWPPNGYVPYQVVYARWSFSYPGADFSDAIVTMTYQEAEIVVTQEPYVEGYGEETLVWRPMNMGDRDAWPQPSTDVTYKVTISNVQMPNKSVKQFTYEVTIIDPESSAAILGSVGK